MNDGTDPRRQPLAFGYLRVLSEAEDRRAYALEQDMKRFAEARGLQLTAIYHEFVTGSLDAFEELTEAVRRTGTRVVLVPSLRHLAENRVVREILLERLETSFGTEVHAVDEDQDRPDAACPACATARPPAG
ncbi:recombinase family protein [Streptomyces sp. DT24]|uniref:recombinase family protein n=1 Tax=unclassified Streptomyces TaxID=2593676 RepID=UPI0023B957DD|nr:recombinase family protein [Streptomyces sp. AM 4-1-1]WEH35561.1 recombinase family protein [Streptomyces sp. AM 4-1-1]